MPVKSERTKPTPEAELRSFIDSFAPNDQKLFRSVRTAVRRRLPTANELAYDYADSVVISYSPTDRAIDAIAAISLRADDVRLYFMNGPQLPDPKRLLQGSGKQARFVSVEAASRLANPDVEALMAAAIAQTGVPTSSNGTPGLIIKSSAAAKQAKQAKHLKQRSSRKPTK
jgi:hypothetical protein